MIIAGNDVRPRPRPSAALTARFKTIRLLTALLIGILFTPAVPLRSQETDSGFSEFGNELAEYIAMPETLMYKMRAGEKGFVVVDLRGPEQFADGHLRGAVNYPWSGGAFLSIFKNLPRNREIFLMSEDGGFGVEALRVLVDAGYTGAYSVEGGMLNWPYTDLLARP
jgi:rhodanese-related sulfurtransferase